MIACFAVSMTINLIDIMISILLLPLAISYEVLRTKRKEKETGDKNNITGCAEMKAQKRLM